MTGNAIDSQPLDFSGNESEGEQNRFERQTDTVSGRLKTGSGPFLEEYGYFGGFQPEKPSLRFKSGDFFVHAVVLPRRGGKPEDRNTEIPLEEAAFYLAKKRQQRAVKEVACCLAR